MKLCTMIRYLKVLKVEVFFYFSKMMVMTAIQLLRYVCTKFFFFSQHPKMRDESERKVIQIDADGKQIVVFKCETCEKPFFTAAQLSGNLRQKTSEMLTCTFFFFTYPITHFSTQMAALSSVYVRYLPK